MYQETSNKTNLSEHTSAKHMHTCTHKVRVITAKHEVTVCVSTCQLQCVYACVICGCQPWMPLGLEL